MFGFVLMHSLERMSASAAAGSVESGTVRAHCIRMLLSSEQCNSTNCCIGDILRVTRASVAET